MSGPPFKPTRPVAAAILLALTAAILWWWLNPDARSRKLASPELHATTSTAPAQTPLTSDRLAPPAEATPGAASQTIKDDLCGIPDAQRYRLPGESFGQHLLRSTAPTLKVWRSNLAASNSDRLAALALALVDVRPDFDVTVDSAPDSDAEQQLILRALDGTDPAIYSLALGVCGAFTGPMPPGSCQGLSFEHWARLDPDNAIPWLWLATRAPAGSPVVDEYLARADSASHFESTLAIQFAGAMDALPASATPLEHSVAGAQLTSLSRLGEPISIAELCDSVALAKPARRQSCERLAHRYDEQSTTAIGAATATILARALGWPPDKVDHMERDVRQIVDAAASMWEGANEDRYRCTLVTRRADYYQQLAHLGNERLALAAFSTTPDAGSGSTSP